MANIGIGIVGGGYMGKAHAVAMSAVATVFDVALRPTLEMVCATTPETAERYRAAYGFRAATTAWPDLVHDASVDAVVIASPQHTHRDIALAALAAGKPVLCEKPLGVSTSEAAEMVAAANASGQVNMTGFNYIKTPATQYARQLIHDGAIGTITSFRGEHTEDFYANPSTPASWRTRDRATGAMGDLASHMIQCAIALVGPIDRLVASVETVHARRPSPDGGSEAVINDDQASALCHFACGATGSLHFSRIATGRKMGLAYDIYGTEGALRFDQEDQNALWLYRADDAVGQRGFRKILMGPEHPDYEPFCQGPAHGTGYQDQIIIEAAHFLRAIADGTPAWPDFQTALDVHNVVDAMHRSSATDSWINLVAAHLDQGQKR